MQIWMVAMLAVSAVLILRDMAKLVFTGRKKGRPVYDVYPQKEKIDRYARSLQKLAHTFYEMPGRQEQLSQAEVQDMFCAGATAGVHGVLRKRKLLVRS